MSFAPERHEVVAEHQIDLNCSEQFKVEVNSFEIHKFVVITSGQFLRSQSTIRFGNVLHILKLAAHSSADAEDGQIKGDQNRRNEDSNKNQNHGLDPTQKGRGPEIDVFVVKVRDVIEHVGKRTRLLTHPHHLDGEIGEMARPFQAVGQRLSLADTDNGL